MNFQDIISNLQNFWSTNGCVILNSYDLEVGAGTLAPHTAIRVLTEKNWNICQLQYCRRPKDARGGENPNRLGGYYQMQIVLKPSPENIQELAIKSLNAIGLKTEEHDFRFIEDNWENPSIGASGLGYELWCDGMEVMQFTYMKQIAGIECSPIPVELTCGLERLAMYVQNVDHYSEIKWNNQLKYSDVHKQSAEKEYAIYYQKYDNDNQFLFDNFDHYLNEVDKLIEHKSYIVAYEHCLKTSHTLNILDSRNLISQNERHARILRIRTKVALIIKQLLLH